jgi:hypothetical protein
MQNQQAPQELLRTVAQMSLLDGILVAIIVILLGAFAYLVYVVIKRLSVGSSSVPQGGRRPWLEYGSFFVVIFGIVAVMIGFLSVLGFLGRFDDVNQALGFLTAFFGAIIGLTGTYFGIKTSADATAGAQRLAGAAGGDTTPPQVLSTNPRDRAPDVPPNIQPTATFSKDMDSATVNPNTFKLLDQVTGNQVRPLPPSGVDYDETTKVATFRPAAALENGKRYGATITSGVKDKAGNALDQDKTWHFTVAAEQHAAEEEADQQEADQQEADE